MKVYTTSGQLIQSSDPGAAPINSPSFTGVPLAPTAAFGTSSYQIATCAFVQAATVVWNSVSGTSVTAVVNNGYIPLDSSLVTVTLPISGAVGNAVFITGQGSGLWKLGQNSGQTVNLSVTPTTTGAAGYLAATNRYDSILVRCVVANSTWVVENAVGSITVV